MTTNLLPGEHLRCLARPHWIVLLRSLAWLPLLLGGAAAASLALHAVPALRGVAALAPAALLLGLVICATVGGAAFISWSSRFVLITDQRAIQQTGIVRRRRTMVPLDRIQDVTTERGVFGALLDYGNIVVTTAGFPVAAARRKSGGEGMVANPSLVLAWVRAPERVARSLFQGRDSGILDDHDGFSTAAGAAWLHGCRQVDGGAPGGGARRRRLHRP